MHWGGPVDLGLTEAQGSEGPPEASRPCPLTGALYTVASANKSGSRAADYCTRPTWPDGPWPFRWSPSPGPHAPGCAKWVGV